MIRSAVLADMPDLMRMVGAFNDAMLPGLRHHPSVACATLKRLMASRLGLVAVLEIDGRLAGLLIAEAAPSEWAARLVAQEKVMWIDPEFRGQIARPVALAGHFEDWATDLGAGLTGVSYIGKSMNLFWQRRGYQPAESCMYKALT